MTSLVASINVVPISEGVSAVLTPHSFNVLIFSSAVPLPPEIIAPRDPYVYLRGVLTSMKPITGLVILALIHSAASSSSSTTDFTNHYKFLVSSSSLNALSTSIKLVPLTGSPPIPTL